MQLNTWLWFLICDKSSPVHEASNIYLQGWNYYLCLLKKIQNPWFSMFFVGSCYNQNVVFLGNHQKLIEQGKKMQYFCRKFIRNFTCANNNDVEWIIDSDHTLRISNFHLISLNDLMCQSVPHKLTHS